MQAFQLLLKHSHNAVVIYVVYVNNSKEFLNQTESLFQLLDARWFCLLQLFPRIPQAICIVFHYDFDTFHLTTLFTITVEHLLLYSIVGSHPPEIQTSREYFRK